MYLSLWKVTGSCHWVTLQAMYKHQGGELKACKLALDRRHAQLEEAQQQLRQEHEEAHASIASFQQQIVQLKGDSFLQA